MADKPKDQPVSATPVPSGAPPQTNPDAPPKDTPTAPQDAPQLTPTGEPHPLQAGGYDPNADPQLPGHISDVEALKEGKATRAQAEALAKADAEKARADAEKAKGKTP